jgi:AraC-like DNA-binding protein
VLVTCLKARGTLIVDGRLHVLEPDQGMLVFPYQGHHYAYFQQADVSWLFVTFELPGEEPLQGMRDLPYELRPVERELLDGVVTSFMASHRRRSDAADRVAFQVGLLLSRLVRRQARYLRRADERRLDSPRHVLVRNAIRFVHEHIDQSTRVADVAEHVAMSESRLRTVFREVVGLGLGEFILRTRIDHACALLHTSELSVSDVAAACGFESLFAFSRAFKRRKQVSPSAYRKQEPGVG